MSLCRFALLAVVGLIALPGAAIAQKVKGPQKDKGWEPPPAQVVPTRNDAEEKNWAKAAYAASLAKPQELAQAKVEAARAQVEARFMEFAAGKITANFLAEAGRMLLEAELAVAATKA